MNSNAIARLRLRSKAIVFVSIRTASGPLKPSIWFGQQIEDIRNDYLEDPVFGMNGMRRVREKVRMPLATNTVVVNFEQLAANVLNTAVDVCCWIQLSGAGFARV